MRSKKEKLYVAFVKDKTEVNHNSYLRLKKKYELTIKEKKKNYYRTLFENYRNDMKRTWHVISDLLGNKKRPKPANEIKIDGTSCTNDTLIANGFNKFFSEIPTKIHKKTPQNRKKLQRLLLWL